jgi:hypothetical protein
LFKRGVGDAGEVERRRLYPFEAPVAVGRLSKAANTGERYPIGDLQVYSLSRHGLN